MNLVVMWKTNKDFRIIVLLLTMAAIFYFLSLMIGDKSTQCREAGGTWLKKYRECENIGLKECFNIGGIYNFCASPCRHYREESIADVCVFKCTEVCEFIRLSK